MTFAKVVNGAIETIGLPTVGRLSDGRSVSNYHLLPVETLNEEGWVEVDETRPEYNSATEQLRFDGYVVTETGGVAANYVVELKPEPEPEPLPQPGLQEQIDEIMFILLGM